jgi:hypothetical protein
MEALVIVAIFWVAPILVGHAIGKPKGRAGWAWGLFLGWLGVIIVALLSPARDVAGRFNKRECTVSVRPARSRCDGTQASVHTAIASRRLGHRTMASGGARTTMGAGCFLTKELVSGRGSTRTKPPLCLRQVIVYAVVDDALSPEFPLGVEFAGVHPPRGRRGGSRAVAGLERAVESQPDDHQRGDRDAGDREGDARDT